MIDEIKYTNKADAMAAVEKDGRALRYTSEALRANREVVMAAIKDCGLALEYASAELRNDPEFVMSAVKASKYGCALEYASEELRKDPDIVLAAMKKNPKVSKYSLLDKGIIKELYQKIPVQAYISKEAYKMSLFDTISKRDNSSINQNEKTLSNIMSFLSVPEAVKLKMTCKETNHAMQFDF